MPRRYSRIHELDLPWRLYDAAILLLLASFVGACAWTRSWTGPFVLPVRFLSVAGFLTIFYGSFIEPRLLAVRRYAVGKGERSIRIAFLSDLHVGPYKGASWVRRLVDRTNGLKPDLVLLGGDFLYRDASDLPELAPLKRLEAPLGTYAIMGNHDEWKSGRETRAWFEASGIPLLVNRSVSIDREGEKLLVSGVDDDWYGEADLEAAFKDFTPDAPAVVMLHNPELAPHAAALLRGRTGATVFFSGHTHGGQIRLPFLGSVARLPHDMGRRFDRGRFTFEGFPLLLGAGTGESGPRARLFCPPEIVLAELRF